MHNRETGMVDIRLRVSLDGLVENIWSPRRGDVLTMPVAAAFRYVECGYQRRRSRARWAGRTTRAR